MAKGVWVSEKEKRRPHECNWVGGFLSKVISIKDERNMVSKQKGLGMLNFI